MWSNLLKKHFNVGLSEDERFKLEKEALNDSFLFEAWEGIHKHSKINVVKSFKVLDQKINASSSKKPKSIVFLYPVAIAASLAVLAAAIYTFLPSRQNSTGPTTAMNLSEELIINETHIAQSETTAIAIATPESVSKQASPITEIKNSSVDLLNKKNKKSSTTPNTNTDKSNLANNTSVDVNDQVDLSEQLSPKAEQLGIGSKLSNEVINESGSAKRSIISEKSSFSTSQSLARSSTPIVDSLGCSPTLGLGTLNKLIEDEKRIKKEDLFMRKIKSPAVVLLGFLINDNGYPIDFKIISSPAEYLNAEAIRLLQLSGKWTSPEPSFQCTYSIVF